MLVLIMRSCMIIIWYFSKTLQNKIIKGPKFNSTIIVILTSNFENHYSIIYIMIIQNNFNAHKSEIAGHSWTYELDRFWGLFKDRDINHLQNIDDYFQKMKKSWEENFISYFGWSKSFEVYNLKQKIGNIVWNKGH